MIGLLVLAIGALAIFALGGAALWRLNAVNDREKRLKAEVLTTATSLVKGGEFDRALMAMDEMMSQVEDFDGNEDFFAKIYRLAAMSFAGKGDYENAIASYHFIFKLNEVDKQVYNELLSLYEQHDYYKYGIPFLEETLSEYQGVTDSNGFLQILLAECYLEEGDRPSAEDILKRMLRYSFSNAHILRQVLNNNQKSHNKSAREANVLRNGSADLAKYYRALEVAVGATAPEIKQAYREICKVWHPDRFTHDPKLQKKAEQKMRDINEAYSILCRQ